MSKDFRGAKKTFVASNPLDGGAGYVTDIVT